MSVTTTVSTITPQYLRNKTKDEIIDLCMILLDDKCRVEKRSEDFAEAIKVAIRKLSIYKGDEDSGSAQSACDTLETAIK